jgi:type III secretion protein V
MGDEGRGERVLEGGRRGRMASRGRIADGALAAFVVLLVGMMVVPLPTVLLDVLLASNIAIAVLLLLVALHLRDGLALSVFPTLLLVTTLYRLALNISSTRLILLQADAGSVIRAFGGFVVQGNYVVGAIVFLLLTIVQFVVIAKGSERVAEVAARFALDAMPGKQMSIDAELRAGAIGQGEARRRRLQLQRESALYGAMDGAMKFVKGDAIAGILVTGVNLLGGLGVGVGMRGMGVVPSLETYGLLTIGDGLVSQIPALLISTAAGVVVTRVAADEDDGAEDRREDAAASEGTGVESSLGTDVGRQVFGDPRSLRIAAAFLVALALVPGLPMLPFSVLGAAFFLLARALDGARRRRLASPLERAEQVESARETRARKERVPVVTPVAVHLAPPLAARLVEDDGSSGPLLDRALPALRDRLFDELGLSLPGVRVRADPALGADSDPGAPDAQAYRLLWQEMPVDGGRLPLDAGWVQADPETLLEQGVRGAVRETAPDPLGRPGPRSRVPESAAGELAELGLPLEDAAEVIARHLERWVHRRAGDLVGLQEVQTLVDQLERVYPALVRNVVPRPVPLALLADVLRRLAEEGVSIRPLREILEALAVHAPNERDPLALAELVRSALGRALTHRLLVDGALPVILLEAEVEEALADAIHTTPTGRYLALAPSLARELVAEARRLVEAAQDQGVGRPVFLARGESRRFFRRLVETELPDTPVLSYGEVAPEATLAPVGRLGLGGSAELAPRAAAPPA